MGIDVTADISAAHADEYARRAQTATPDELSALFYEALGEGRFAAHGELDSLRAEVELATMRVGSLTAEVEAQRQQISALVAEVERLKRERAAREADSLAALTEWAEKYRECRRVAMEEGFADGMEHAAYFIGEFTELVGCQKCGELVPDAAHSIAFMIREESKRYLEFKKSQVVAAAIRAAAKEGA